MEDIMLRYKSICVFKAAAKEVYPLAALACCRDETRAVELAAEVFSAVAERGCDTTGEWIKYLLRRDDNVFSRTAARGGRVSARLKSQVISELAVFKRLSLVKPDDFATETIAEFLPRFGFGGMSVTYERLLLFYMANGCGMVSVGSTFVYRDGELFPADFGDAVLSDIKNYAEEKAEIVRNTENFIAGLPAFHALLYGDCGTGKTATVRAIAREYRDRINVIEVSSRDVSRIGTLRAELAGLKQKFILFVDNLDSDGNGAIGKSLEAELDSPCGNTLVYCTCDSRRRAEDGEERQNRDTQSELALFDRFGLVVTYMIPGKEEFIDILKQILRSRGIRWREEYSAVAELAALKKGGRSPRAAKQIAELIESNYAQRRCD